MGIEWMPRSGAGNGWRDPSPSTTAGAPRLVGDAGNRGVYVPVAPTRLGRDRMGTTAARTAALGGAAVATGAHHVWPALVTFSVLGVSSAAVLGQRLALRHRYPSLTLTPEAVRTDDLVLPWSVIDGVVRFSARSPEPIRGKSRVWNHLALRIDDFDNVAGLTPFRAGLANLTRRHLVLVADAGELRDPGVVATALEFLVERPEARLLLSGSEGVRLLTEGPRAF